MAGKVIVGLVTLAAILTVVPGVPGAWLMAALVVLGLIHGYMGVSDEDASAFAIGAVALAAAGHLDVLASLDLIGGIGSYLDGIVDGLVVAALSAVVTRAVLRIVGALTADG